MTIRDIKTNLILESWEKKYTELLNEYTTGKHSEVGGEVSAMIESRLEDILHFINDLKVIHPDHTEQRPALDKQPGKILM